MWNRKYFNSLINIRALASDICSRCGKNFRIFAAWPGTLKRNSSSLDYSENEIRFLTPVVDQGSFPRVHSDEGSDHLYCLLKTFIRNNTLLQNVIIRSNINNTLLSNLSTCPLLSCFLFFLFECLCRDHTVNDFALTILLSFSLFVLLLERSGSDKV
uniref:Uncharacterized protein n=1 Tax=Glossina brevipalpis TaxID=37001 RepID=A0A1A9W0B4_9MUSC